MSQYLPTREFKWLLQDDIRKLNANRVRKDNTACCILEDDLEYSEMLHNLRNDSPLAPETIEVKQNMLLDYLKKIENKYNISVGKVKELVPNLSNKNKFALHYQSLLLCLQL